jgi:hypothetical protein
VPVVDGDPQRFDEMEIGGGGHAQCESVGHGLTLTRRSFGLLVHRY